VIIVHHLNNSRSQRIVWLLEDLGVRYQRDPETMLAPAALRAVHPLGKSPVITDGNVTVAESGAIIEYLVGQYGQGRLVPPPGTPERLRYTYWLHFAEGSAMPPLLMKLVFDRLESELADRDWFAGPEFTAADVQMSFPIEVAQARGGLDASRPRLMEFLRRIHARPCYRAALERGGEYALLT
jgi:glutathione S-transferase